MNKHPRLVMNQPKNNGVGQVGVLKGYTPPQVSGKCLQGPPGSVKEDNKVQPHNPQASTPPTSQ